MLIIFFIIRGRSTTPTNNNNTGGQITLQWWGVYLDPDVVNPLIQEYQAQNTNVKIQYANKWPGGNRELAAKLYQDELNRVLKDRNAAAIPDIFMVENTWVGNYERYTAPAPASIVTAQNVSSEFYPAVTQNFVSGGVVRGLPLWMDALAIIYNRDLLTAKSVSTPSTNWVDFRTLALTLTTRQSGRISVGGFAAGLTKSVSFSAEIFNLLLLQNGVTIVNNQGRPVFANSTAAAISAFEFFKSFAGTTGSWDATMETDALEFLKKRAAMIVAPSWRYQDLLTLNKANNLGVNIGVAAMPQLQGQNQPTINWATYWGNMAAIDRPNSTEAWKFMRWITQPAQLRKLRTNDAAKREFFSFMYPRSDMAADLQADQYLRVFNSSLPTAQSWYMVNGMSVQAAFEELLETSGGSNNLLAIQNKIDQIILNKGNI